ncbi:MAG: hypothetical protein AAFU67_13995, partial [Bacteroidota bacterium]
LDPFKDPYCQGDTFFLRSPIFDVGDFPGIEHMWVDAPGLQTGDSLYNGFVIAQDTSLFLRISTNGACIDTNEVQVNVVTPPPFTLTPQDTAICPGGSVQFLFEITDGTTGTISWMPDDGTLSCLDCFNPVATPMGSTQYSIEFTPDEGDCPLMTGTSVTVLDLPNPDLVNPIICPGDGTTIFGSIQAGVSYEIVGGGITTNDPTTILSPDVTTTYTVTASNACDTVMSSATITVLEEVTVSIVAPDEACVGDLVTISAQTDAGDGILEEFTWIVNGAIVSSQQSFNLEVQQTLNISLTYRNACQSESLTAMTVVFPAPSLDVTDVRTICAGESVTLNDAPNAATTTYQWSGDDGFSSTDAAPTVSPTQTTTYTVTAMSSDVCPTREETFTIEVIQQSTLSTSPMDTTICLGESVTLSASTTPNTAGTYVWADPEGNTFEGADLTVAPGVTGTYTIVFTDAAGCFPSTTATSTIEVLPALPPVSIIATDENGMVVDSVFNGVPVTLTASDAPTGFTYTYTWDGDGDPPTGEGQSITVITPSVMREGSMTYNVMVESQPGGCMTSGSITLTVFEASN